MRFKIHWASLIVESKFTVFALFYFVFEGNFQVQAPGGLIFGGAYTWRGLFSEFYGMLFFRAVYVGYDQACFVGTSWSVNQ